MPARLHRFGAVALAALLGALPATTSATAAPVGPGTAARPRAAAAQTPVRREAEQTTLTPGAGTSYPDSRASAGRALLVWSNGTARTTLSSPATGPATAVQVRARGDLCDGAPLVRVAVDGTVVGTAAVRQGWSTTTFAGWWSTGVHTVAVTFPNDHLSASCDRNLRLDTFGFTAATPVRSFGLSSEGPDRGLSTAVQTGSTLGRRLDVFNTYEDWGWQGPLPVADLRTIAAIGAVPEITWEAWVPGAGVAQPAYSLSSIAGGGHDAYISSWARDAAAYGQPLLLRFGHEMNGSWYPWAAAANGGSAQQYVAAYRHVHDLFVAAGARNVKWVWSPNVQEGMPTPLAAVWPGAAYVDLIGVDGYNGGTDVPAMGGWRTPAQVFAGTLTALRTLAPGVPVMLNEVGSAAGGGDKAAWIGQLFSFLRTTQVTGVLWFDHRDQSVDWGVRGCASCSSALRAALAGW